MREIRISKGNGTFRTVYVPSRGERRRLDKLLPVLMAAERAAALALGTQDVAHGFVADRSPVTCAMAHAGLAVSVCCDLAGWFDSVRPEQIRAGLVEAGADPSLAEKVCHLGAPRQGLPTSPAAANLAAVKLDRDILESLRNLPCKVVYTRYADDLTVSLSDAAPELVDLIRMSLGVCAARHGWALAAHKTKVQQATAGRRVIVGVSIGENAGDRMAPRWQRRRLRAAQHQGANRPEARGLAEWCSMKLPRALRGYRIAADLSAATVAAGAAAGYNLADAIDRAVYADFLDEQGQDGESVRQTLRHG